MKKMDQAQLEAVSANGPIGEWGGGLCCGLAIGEAFASGGILVLVAVGTCAWALG